MLHPLTTHPEPDLDPPPSPDHIPLFADELHTAIGQNERRNGEPSRNDVGIEIPPERTVGRTGHGILVNPRGRGEKAGMDRRAFFNRLEGKHTDPQGVGGAQTCKEFLRIGFHGFHCGEPLEREVQVRLLDKGQPGLHLSRGDTERVQQRTGDLLDPLELRKRYLELDHRGGVFLLNHHAEDSALRLDTEAVGAGGLHPRHPFDGQRMKRSDRGMAAQRHFHLRREPAHLDIGIPDGGGQNEGRFRQVHLPRNRLHPDIGKSARIEDHPRGISREGSIGKGIDMFEKVGFHGSPGIMRFSAWYALLSYKLNDECPLPRSVIRIDQHDLLPGAEKHRTVGKWDG